jgi:glutaredoxin 3
MVQVRMYIKARCPYCSLAEQTLREYGVAEIIKVHVDHDEESEKHMKQKLGTSQVPQFVIGDRHIGGFDELAAMKHNGELTRLLAN